MSNSYFERLNTFKSEIKSASSLAKQLKLQHKECQRVYAQTASRQDLCKMNSVLWELEKNTRVTNALLQDRQILKKKAIDYWTSKKVYNQTTVVTE